MHDINEKLSKGQKSWERTKNLENAELSRSNKNTIKILNNRLDIAVKRISEPEDKSFEIYTV